MSDRAGSVIVFDIVISYGPELASLEAICGLLEHKAEICLFWTSFYPCEPRNTEQRISFDFPIDGGKGQGRTESDTLKK